MPTTCTRRNSDFSLGIILYGISAVLIYLFLFTFKKSFNFPYDKQTILIIILLISILGAFIVVIVFFVIRYYIYKYHMKKISECGNNHLL